MLLQHAYISSWPGGRFCVNFSARPAMSPLFNFGKSQPPQTRDAVQAEVPELKGANLSAIYYGQRVGGDFYDFLRVSPKRVLFGLLDVAGGLEESRGIIAAAQHTFRTLGAELFAKEDIN